jgi:hypothetical protein
MGQIPTVWKTWKKQVSPLTQVLDLWGSVGCFVQTDQLSPLTTIQKEMPSKSKALGWGHRRVRSEEAISTLHEYELEIKL